MREPTICICENRGTDQRLSFRYRDSIITLLDKSEISSFSPCSVLVQLGLCRTCSKTTVGFLMKQFIFIVNSCYTIQLFLGEERIKNGIFDI